VACSKGYQQIAAHSATREVRATDATAGETLDIQVSTLVANARDRITDEANIMPIATSVTNARSGVLSNPATSSIKA